MNIIVKIDLINVYDKTLRNDLFNWMMNNIPKY